MVTTMQAAAVEVKITIILLLPLVQVVSVAVDEVQAHYLQQVHLELLLLLVT
jgi:hypothetical protein